MVNARYPQIYVKKHWKSQIFCNFLILEVAVVQTQKSTKNGENGHILTKKTWFKNYFWMVWGHVWTGIFTLVNLPPTLSMNCIFLRQKSLIDFLPIFCPFSLLGRLPQAIPTPWKCFLGVPWWKTFHLGPRKPPKPLLAKKISASQILNYTPSPLCVARKESQQLGKRCRCGYRFGMFVMCRHLSTKRGVGLQTKGGVTASGRILHLLNNFLLS